MTVEKGVVTSVNGNTARVSPIEKPDEVSPFLEIPYFITDHYELKPERKIQKGDTVAYTQFNDGTGIIIAKMGQLEDLPNQFCTEHPCCKCS